jgi:hypothetical protein
MKQRLCVLATAGSLLLATSPSSAPRLRVPRQALPTGPRAPERWHPVMQFA